MPKKVIDENKEIVNLLAKLLVLQLYSLSVHKTRLERQWEDKNYGSMNF